MRARGTKRHDIGKQISPITHVTSDDPPVLIIHGDADKTVPIEPTGNQAAKLIPDSQYIIYEGAPHGLFYTDRERLNTDLIQFIRESVSAEVH